MNGELQDNLKSLLKFFKNIEILEVNSYNRIH